MIVRAHGPDDVVAALAAAREAGLEVSVRGGGHNVAGRAVTNGGVMIDLAEMKGIDVDPAAQTVRAEGGVLWSELNDAAAEHGLAVTGGAISTTGIAGYTLGGGLGWLMAKHGLAADNLLGVELVTADGEVLDVSAESHPDLFWALRGGGGNFGVATAFTYRVHPLQMVVGGLIAHPIDAGPEMLRFYRDAVAGCSDDFTVFAALVHAPDGSGHKIAGMIVFHTGSEEEAEREIAPFREWGSPLMVEIGPMPYPVMNTILDEGYPAGSLNYWLSSFTNGIPDELIDTAAERFASVPSPMSAILFEHFHGAVTRVGVERHRRAAPLRGLEPAAPERLARPGRHGRERRVDAGARSTRSSRTSAAAAGSTTSPTTRATTPSAPPTAPTTTGSWRSSAPTTRRTCSGSTTTSCPDAGRPPESAWRGIPGCPASSRASGFRLAAALVLRQLVAARLRGAAQRAALVVAVLADDARAAVSRRAPRARASRSPTRGNGCSRCPPRAVADGHRRRARWLAKRSCCSMSVPWATQKPTFDSPWSWKPVEWLGQPGQQPHLHALVLVEQRVRARVRFGRRQLDAVPGARLDDLRRERLALGRGENPVVCRDEAGDAAFHHMEVAFDLLLTPG